MPTLFHRAVPGVSSMLNAQQACDAVILALCTLLLALQLFVRLVKIRGSLLPHHCFSMLAWCFVVVGLSGDLHRIHQAQKVQTTVVNVMENPQNAVRDLSNLVTWGVSIAKVRTHQLHNNIRYSSGGNMLNSSTE